MTQNASEKSGGGFLGALKGLVYEDAPQAAVTHAPPPIAAPVLASPATGAVDPQVRKVLERDVGEAAKPALSEFQVLSDSMAAVLPDERLRSQAVLAALAAKGHSVQQVLIDIDECFAALDRKASEAAKAAEQARASRVGSKVAEIANLSQRIAALQAQIDALQLDATRLNSEVDADNAAIAETERNFAITVAAYKAELTALKAKISTPTNGAR